MDRTEAARVADRAVERFCSHPGRARWEPLSLPDSTGVGEVFLRRSHRLHDGRFVDCLDLATVVVHEPWRRCGLLTGLLTALESRTPGGVWVESVLHRWMRDWLTTRGYQPTPADPLSFLRAHPREP